MPPITIKQQIAEVDREIGLRKSVYARRVESGKMTEHDAKIKIQIMAAVRVSLESYQRMIQEAARD